MIGKVVTDNVLGNGIISHNTVGGLSPEGDAGLISEFVMNCSQYANAFTKSVSRGYAVAGFIPGFGFTTPSTITIGSGAVLNLMTRAGTDLQQSVPALYEYDPDSGAAETITFVMISTTSGTSAPANNDANYFKSLKLINTTQNTTTVIQRSDFQLSTLNSTSGNGFRANFTRVQTVNINNLDVIKVQLRSD
jgi:hypothetical protein